MCGIIGYAGHQRAEPILIEGLRRLEYRGYDSSGLATLDDGRLNLRKKAGRIDALAGLLRERPAAGCVGISHTRWATHGPATDANAHPHLSADGAVAVVHNGVIENYAALKRQLEPAGAVPPRPPDPGLPPNPPPPRRPAWPRGGAVGRTLRLQKAT